MAFDFRNTNTLWASILVETLQRLGLATAIICPGSRSTPLAVAFAQNEHIEAIPVLDERSASFFALGLARQQGHPVVLLCTSGTAGANFFPAVIEATESRVPLLILTADRPPELRDCNAGQTVDQQKLYGSFPNWYHEVVVPSPELSLLSYLRQTVVHAWERALFPSPGVVHLNFPFRDPLAPIPQVSSPDGSHPLQELLCLDEAAFFAEVRPLRPVRSVLAQNSTISPKIPNIPDIPVNLTPSLLPTLEGAAFGPDVRDSAQPPPPNAAPLPRVPSRIHVSTPPPLHPSTFPESGIILAGPAQPYNPYDYCEAIAHLSKTLGYPILAEGLSPLRNYADLNPYLISTYDSILRDLETAKNLAPQMVIRVGETPTSKLLRAWLSDTQPIQWLVEESDRNLDPLHLRTTHLRLSVEQLAMGLSEERISPSPYLKQWCEAELQVQKRRNQSMEEEESLIEGKVVWLMSRYLPPETPLFIANSMPIRYMEWFWKPGNRRVQPFFNRGANGIDGTLSTALGMAHGNRPGVLLTGDLALLHDTNGFLVGDRLRGHLTIVLINNNGGGIFESLPIAQFEPPFEEFFATPQCVDFMKLCAAYEVEHEAVESWGQLQQRLGNLPERGIRLLEVRCDRKANTRWLQKMLPLWGSGSL